MQVSDSGDVPAATNTPHLSTSTNTSTDLDCSEFPALSPASPVTKVPIRATSHAMVCRKPDPALLNLPSPVCRTSQAVLDAKLAKLIQLQVGVFSACYWHAYPSMIHNCQHVMQQWQSKRVHLLVGPSPG